MIPTDDAVLPIRQDWRAEGATLFRAVLSSAGATAVDGIGYAVSFVIALRMGVESPYVVAAVLGAVAGAVTNFAVNRRWVFRSMGASLFAQGAHYAGVWLVTLLVLRTVLWFMVDRLGFDARVAWLPAKLVTWMAFSYPLQRIWVFKEELS
jgi:putative flippase GtrA